MNGTRPIRILQVVGGMNRGGVETWLMHILRHIDRSQFKMDFLVHTRARCAYDEEIRALGSEIIPCERPQRPLSYGRRLRQILKQRGPYDIVHSHVHFFSGFVMRIAAAAGISLRIAHSHSNSANQDLTTCLVRRAYLHASRHCINKHMTHGLAASKQAAHALFGCHWTRDTRIEVLHCGIDLQPFITTNRAEARIRLGIHPTDFVIGHVGRFDVCKNHSFLIQVAAEVAHQRPSTKLVLVGDGPLRSEIEDHLRRFDMLGNTILAGSRSDVPTLLAAMDVFLFPSISEGLGLALIEAQAAGLPSYVAESIPTEAILVPELVSRLSLSAHPALWASAITARSSCSHSAHNNPLRTVLNSPFTISHSIRRLMALYTRYSAPVAIF